MSPVWLFSLILVISCEAQDCRTPGESCRSEQDCCGGCCQGSKCIHTYTPCNQDDDPCMSHTCPPGFECYLYHPEDCPGCDVTPDCKESDSE